MATTKELYACVYVYMLCGPRMFVAKKQIDVHHIIVIIIVLDDEEFTDRATTNM
jgi:hypothetical protein